MGAPELIVILLMLLIGGGVGAAIGARTGRTFSGFLLGALVGPIGWVVLLLVPNNWPKCPDCMGDVVKGARKCKNCGSELRRARKRKRSASADAQRAECLVTLGAIVGAPEGRPRLRLPP